MPTYDYRCNNCGHEFEQFQSITADPLRKCPECGEDKLKRLIGAGSGVIFKGNGFYETDYRSKSYQDAAKKDTQSDTKPKSESKSETKKEDKPKDSTPKKEAGDKSK